MKSVSVHAQVHLASGRESLICLRGTEIGVQPPTKWGTRRAHRRGNGWLVFALIFSIACTLGAQIALALNTPKHAPGTICYTADSWCWAQPPGPPDSECSCPSPQGLVKGIRG